MRYSGVIAAAGNTHCYPLLQAIAIVFLVATAGEQALADTGSSPPVAATVSPASLAAPAIDVSRFGAQADFAQAVFERYRGRREPALITTRNAGALLHSVLLEPLSHRLADFSGLDALDDLLKGRLPHLTGFPTVQDAATYECDLGGSVSLNVTHLAGSDTHEAGFSQDYRYNDCRMSGASAAEPVQYNGRLQLAVFTRGAQVEVTGIVDGLQIVAGARQARQDGILRQTGDGLSNHSLDLIVLTGNPVTGLQYLEAGTRLPGDYAHCMPSGRQVLSRGRAWHSEYGYVDVEQRQSLAYDFVGLKPVPQGILAAWQFDCDAPVDQPAGRIRLHGANSTSLTLDFETLRDAMANPLAPAALANLRIDGPAKQPLSVQSAADRWPAGQPDILSAAAAQVTIGLDALRAGVLENIDDLDADGMLDGWEQWRQLSADDTSDAAADPDGDGLSNLEEFRRHSDPRDATSIRY